MDSREERSHGGPPRTARIPRAQHFFVDLIGHFFESDMHCWSFVDSKYFKV